MNFGPVLTPDGTSARLDATLAWWLLLGGAALFALVLALLLRGVFSRARPLRPGLWVLGGGVLLPLLVLGALGSYGLRDLAGPAFAPSTRALVAIDAKPWWWQIRLIDPAGGADLVLANELVLPVGRPVRLALTSHSLIHSLWVPALAGKMDLIPGHINHLTLQADRPGTWRGPCAEFCGIAHARMVLNVVALPPPQYEAWLRQQRQDAAPPRTPAQQRGRQHFIELQCGNCHTVRGVVRQLQGLGIDPDMGGPDLTHLASRQFLGAGTLANDADGLRAWIGNAPQLKPGTRMPSYERLDAATLDALVAYLHSLE